MGELGEMYEAVDIPFETEEGSVIRKADDGSLDTLAHGVPFGNFFPWILGQLLDAQGKFFAIKTNYFHRHAVPNLRILCRVLHVAPCNFRNVDETLQSFEGHEESKLYEAAHNPFFDVAHLEAFESF